MGPNSEEIDNPKENPSERKSITPEPNGGDKHHSSRIKGVIAGVVFVAILVFAYLVVRLTRDTAVFSGLGLLIVTLATAWATVRKKDQ